jgi:Asp-tRNA(Asn)/Glu-tRNA(Gln) amidotransferase A subunit family amidase
MWGITRNPWNTEWGPGGSSGGSGAALAAGLATLATGTDIGGSIRIPAAACGVVGFKPPHGRNPDGPPANFDRFNHCGPMTRTVADAALMQNITAGPHPLDHDSLRQTVELPAKATSLRGMKIAWSIDFDFIEVENDVRLNTRAALEVFKSLGAIVEEVKLGWTAETERDCMYWYTTMHFGRQHLWHRAKHADIMNDYSLRMADACEKASLDNVHKSWERAHLMYQTLGPILDKYDAFICPGNNAASVKADHDPWDPTFTVNGKKADPEYGWVMAYPFNMLHNLPVMSVPSGHAATGVPTGIQIVGPSWRDDIVFKAALAYEKALGGWYTEEKKRPNL